LLSRKQFGGCFVLFGGLFGDRSRIAVCYMAGLRVLTWFFFSWFGLGFLAGTEMRWRGSVITHTVCLQFYQEELFVDLLKCYEERPNQSLEATPFGAFCTALAVHGADRRWLNSLEGR
jgi:hypothetical protein